MTEIERRFVQTELRMVADGDHRQLIGYGAVFNQLSREIMGFQEIIMPGAFADVLADDVRSFFNHTANLILGRTVAGTLRLSQDNIGLHYEVDLPDTQYARDLKVNMDRGDVTQSSFGFRVDPKAVEWRSPDRDNPLPVRVIHKFKILWDVGPVTLPAYDVTTAEVRDMARQILAGVDTGGDDDEAQPVGRLAILRRRLALAEKQL